MPSSPPPSPPPLLAAGGLYAAVGLVRRPEVNGKVGALVATRAPGNGERALLRLAGTGEVVRAKPANLEAYVADGEGAPKCGVEHGKLPEVPFGQAFCFILDCARFVANEAAGQRVIDMKSPDDVDKLRGDDAGYRKLQFLTSRMYTFWRMLPGGRGSVLGEVTALVEANLTQVPWMRDVLDDLRGELADVERWGDERSRVHEAFYIAKKRSDGTLVVLASAVDDDDLDAGDAAAAVYLVLGQSRSLYDVGMQYSHDGLPPSVNLTLLPYRHRIVYDGLVKHRVNTNTGGTRVKTTPAIAARVRELAERAERDGTVVSNLSVKRADLPRLLPDGVSAGVPDLSNPQVMNWRAMLSAASKSDNPEDPRAMLIMRRFGYTEEDNAEHMVGVVDGGGAILTAFATAALEPTPFNALHEVHGSKVKAFISSPRGARGAGRLGGVGRVVDVEFGRPGEPPSRSFCGKFGAPPKTMIEVERLAEVDATQADRLTAVEATEGAIRPFQNPSAAVAAVIEEAVAGSLSSATGRPEDSVDIAACARAVAALPIMRLAHPTDWVWRLRSRSQRRRIPTGPRIPTLELRSD